MKNINAYSDGHYFCDPMRHAEDTRFKAENFLRLFSKIAKEKKIKINSYADVGCGSGELVRNIFSSLNENGVKVEVAKGYDISPHVKDIKDDHIQFIHGDFTDSQEQLDLVTLFDVFEHIPDPIDFIRKVSKRTKFIGFHIPLDNSINTSFRNMFKSKLKNPGHLIFMDAPLALNILCLSGLRVIDYEYTFSFLAPSGRATLFSKLVLPFRWLIAKISPWFLSKTLGGASLLVIAATQEYFMKSEVAEEI